VNIGDITDIESKQKIIEEGMLNSGKRTRSLKFNFRLVVKGRLS